jgi:hypothetical protein
MDNQRAIKIIIDYLVAGNPSEEDLVSATRFLRKNHPEALDRLWRGLMLDEGRDEYCETICSDMDMFAEMGMEALEKNLPVVAEHIKQCESCLRAWWRIKPAFIVTKALKVRKQQVKTLVADEIVAEIGNNGEIRAISGMPPVEHIQMAGELKEPWQNLEEWRLEDFTSGLVASLLMWTPPQKQGAKLKIIITDFANRPLSNGKVKLELYRQKEKVKGITEQVVARMIRSRYPDQDGHYQVEVSVEKMTSKVVQLQTGNYEINISWTCPDRALRFKIPLKII